MKTWRDDHGAPNDIHNEKRYVIHAGPKLTLKMFGYQWSNIARTFGTFMSQKLFRHLWRIFVKKNNLRALSGKLLFVIFCWPESFAFLRLCLDLSAGCNNPIKKTTASKKVDNKATHTHQLILSDNHANYCPRLSVGIFNTEPMPK